MSGSLDEALALHRAGRLEEAARAYQAALAGGPQAPVVSGLLGDVLQALGRDGEAEIAYRAALRGDPTLAIVHMNLGMVLRRQGKMDQALSALEQAARRDPRLAEAHLNLGLVLFELGRAEDATASCQRAIAVRPDYAEAYLNLGSALHALGRHGEARAAYEAALKFRPGYAQAHHSLGVTLFELGDLDGAIACYRQALAASPDHEGARDNLAFLLRIVGRSTEAAELYRQGAAAGQATAMRYLALSTLYDPHADLDARYAEQRQAEDRLARPLYAHAQPHANSREPERRLRIGYLSSDFRDHPVGRNIEPLLANRNRDRFEIIAYADIASPDHMTKRLRDMVDRWTSVTGLSDRQIAEKIRADEVDILVVLAAHFDKNRPLVCAFRPSPIQISFHDLLSTGLEAVDYFIADRTVHPRGAREHFTERVIHLPSLYVHAPLPDVPVAPPPSAASGVVTFGSYNNPAKINDAVLSLWAAILKATPRSRLLLKFRNWFLVTSLRERITSALRAHGIEPSRVSFQGAPDATASHLARYNDIDIALDTFPFSGSTTTFEALWMGVPVITWAGTTVASRWSASMLRALKLDELVADGAERYAAIASALADDPKRLAMLRSSLRGRVLRSPLVDGPLRARQIERVYRAVWRRWCRWKASGG